jgi:hypothetical protein
MAGVHGKVLRGEIATSVERRRIKRVERGIPIHRSFEGLCRRGGMEVACRLGLRDSHREDGDFVTQLVPLRSLMLAKRGILQIPMRSEDGRQQWAFGRVHRIDIAHDHLEVLEGTLHCPIGRSVMGCIEPKIAHRISAMAACQCTAFDEDRLELREKPPLRALIEQIRGNLRWPIRHRFVPARRGLSIGRRRGPFEREIQPDVNNDQGNDSSSVHGGTVSPHDVRIKVKMGANALTE